MNEFSSVRALESLSFLDLGAPPPEPNHNITRVMRIAKKELRAACRAAHGADWWKCDTDTKKARMAAAKAGLAAAAGAETTPAGPVVEPVVEPAVPAPLAEPVVVAATPEAPIPIAPNNPAAPRDVPSPRPAEKVPPPY